MGEAQSHALDGFMESGADLAVEVEMIASAPDLLTEDQVAILWMAISSRMGEEEVVFDSEFSLANEIESQIRLVRLMRANVATPDGKTLLVGTSPRDLKDIITASTNLLTTLVKNQSAVINFSRMQAIERATSEAVRTLPEQDQQRFFALLEAKLEVID